MSSQNIYENVSKMGTQVTSLVNQVTNLSSLKPHAQAHLISPTEKCQICSEPAARHVHYGARTCFGCRAFFRRSLQNKTANKFLCRRQSRCEINIKTRKNCQYCRYMKCLAIGMNPSFVLSENERKERFRKRQASSEGDPVDVIPVIPIVVSVTMKIPVKTKYGPKVENCSQISEEQNEFQGNISCESLTTTDTQNKSYFPPETASSHEVKANESQNSTFAQITDSVPNTNNIFPIENDIVMTKNEPFYNHENVSKSKLPTFDEFFKNSNKIMADENISINTVSLIDDTKVDTELYENSLKDFEKKLVLTQEPEISFTVDEKYMLEQLVKEHDTVYHSVNFGEVLIKEMLMCSMFGVPVSTSAAIQGYRLQVERISRIANNLTTFTNLTKIDQVALLKENADLLVSLRGAIFFDKKKSGVDQIMSSMGVDDLDTIDKTFKCLIENHHLNHIDYKVFNSIQDTAAKKIEEHYSFLQGKVADAILDNLTSILMTYIILFSSDFCSLENRRLVEKTQLHYLRILERCLYSDTSRHEACSKMARLLNAVTCVREMADIKKSRAINNSATAQITA